MRRVLGFVNVVFGLVFMALSALALLGAPSQYEDRAKEPEDFFGLLILFALGAAVACVTLCVGIFLVRGRCYSWRATPALWLSGVVTVALLAGIALLDVAGPDDPGTFGMRILLVPAIALALSHFRLG